MDLSSDSIVHFTKTKDALKKILEGSFRLKYCREEVPVKKNPIILHVPMVSFCDIPMSKLKRHIDSYGGYGIGMKREWAIKNRLNPVLYIQSGSMLAEAYFEGVKYFVMAEDSLDDFSERSRAEDNLIEVFRYAKPYEGLLIRSNGERIENYRFSDEREWRYVPPVDESHRPFYADKDFSDLDFKRGANEVLSSVRLNFDLNDIKYIIIKEDSEIHEFVLHINEVRGHDCYAKDVERVITRIITAEQIRTDF